LRTAAAYRALATAVAVLLAIAPSHRVRANETLTVFAAASLGSALDAVADAWSAESGVSVTLSFAGSAALARQIQHGAPADLFISASTEWMDAVEQSGDLQADTRRDILGNRLVLIAHDSDAPQLTIDSGLDLAALLGDGRLAMAMTDSVPAGIYGQQALRTLGQWDAVTPRVAQSDNVRAALAFVAQGEAPLGIVYATDARIEDDVTVIGTFPAESHAPIVYPAAITAQSRSRAAHAFLDFLGSRTAAGIWNAAGFSVLD